MERVIIARGFSRQPRWKIIIGVPLIYLPLLLTVPFAVITVLLVRTHLNYIGAVNLRSYASFVPSWASHRYRYADQITYRSGAAWYNVRSYRLYWLFNCKLYCPLSVALFSYLSYLVKVVENWWCPFGHDKKAGYGEGAVDRSYWHLHLAEQERLHPEDRNNPLWNSAAQRDDRHNP
ncbi:MAG: hypothetical protein OQL08_05855 [Gammaproteobacteria bacterium]|nr:hypothetical protein [Gammaproteobacteria bacterium]